jgi:hypothetical protein
MTEFEPRSSVNVLGAKALLDNSPCIASFQLAAIALFALIKPYIINAEVVRNLFIIVSFIWKSVH